MKIGIVGYQGSGKSCLFEWLTEQPADPQLAHKTQSAMAQIPEARVQPLCDIYHPKKITLASLEIVDTPGLSRGHEDGASKLALIREAGCLVIVVAGFGGNSAEKDLQQFEEDLLIADLDIVSRRIERLRESVKKPRPNRDEQLAELDALLPLHEVLERGEALHRQELSPQQQRVIKSFQLLSEKPRLIVVNVSDDDTDSQRYQAIAPKGVPLVAISLELEKELASMEPEEREAFCQEMEVSGSDRDALIRAIMDASGQMLFFTAGEKEVRTWLIPRGATALDAADSIHTDLARGFIRAETMQVDDLVSLGSEREVKAQGRIRQEPKDYVIQDGDILLIRHN